jgi:hypothetical protein
MLVEPGVGGVTAAGRGVEHAPGGGEAAVEEARGGRARGWLGRQRRVGFHPQRGRHDNTRAGGARASAPAHPEGHAAAATHGCPRSGPGTEYCIAVRVEAPQGSVCVCVARSEGHEARPLRSAMASPRLDHARIDLGGDIGAGCRCARSGGGPGEAGTGGARTDACAVPCPPVCAPARPGG